MLGAIAGDVIGSVFEFNPLRGGWNDFPLFAAKSFFTDDTVMTLALMEAILKTDGDARLEETFIAAMREFGRKWPDAGYGGRFRGWLKAADPKPYNSFGNGSAMRVSPAGWTARSLEEAEDLAERSARVTHNHPEGVRGAQATAGAVHLARKGASREEIRAYLTGRCGYDLGRSVAEIREMGYGFDETCQGSVPQALTAFLESANFEEAVRKAVWLGGDADTQAAIAGSVAEAFYGGVPDEIARQTLARLDDELHDVFRRGLAYLRAREA